MFVEPKFYPIVPLLEPKLPPSSWYISTPPRSCSSLQQATHAAPGCINPHNTCPAFSSFASGTRCGPLLCNGQSIRPIPMTILSPEFTTLSRASESPDPVLHDRHCAKLQTRGHVLLSFSAYLSYSPPILIDQYSLGELSYQFGRVPTPAWRKGLFNGPSELLRTINRAMSFTEPKSARRFQIQ